MIENIIVLSISLLLMMIVMYFDKITNFKIAYSVIISVMIVFLLNIINTGLTEKIKLSILLSLLASASFTDIREKKILNINLYFVNIAIIAFLIIDAIFKVNIFNSIVGSFISLIICICLNKMKQLGSGDIPFIVILSYLYRNRVLIIFGIACIITLLVAITDYTIFKNRENKIPLAPGLFIAVIIYIVYNSALITQNVCVSIC